MGSFEDEFLSRYLAVGLGALGKKDTEVLVMHLLDQHGGGPHKALRSRSNQDVSVLLKTPVSRIRQLRYEAGLKYSGDPEELAKAKLLASLSQAVFEVDDKKVCLIIEDALAKSWLQGKLKSNGLIFDYSFNTEIVKVEADGLFKVLSRVFGKTDSDAFRQDYDVMLAQVQQDKWAKTFKSLALKFAQGVARTTGSAVVAGFKGYVAAP